MTRIKRYKNIDSALQNPLDVKHLVLKRDNFPLQVCSLNNLEVLRIISPDNIIHIPDEIINLSKLRVLAFPNTEVGIFHSFIGELKNLEKINFGKNVCEISENVWKLNNLKGIRIDCSRMLKFPDSILYSQSIEHIEISGLKKNTNVKLAEILSILSELPKLKSLNLSRQEISHLPKEIGGLKNLEYLDITHTDLLTLPEELSKLVNLNTIRLMKDNSNLKTQIKKYLPNKGKLISKWIIDVRSIKATQYAVEGVQMYITKDEPTIYNNV